MSAPIERTLDRLATSAFRRRFKLGPKERAYLARTGRDTVLLHARRFIAERLAPARPVNDGKQTPFRGHPVFVAQHATATCCRGCLQKWHAMAEGEPLTPDQQSYVIAVIAAWLDRQPADQNRQASRPNDADLPQSDPQLTFIRD